MAALPPPPPAPPRRRRKEAIIGIVGGAFVAAVFIGALIDNGSSSSSDAPAPADCATAHPAWASDLAMPPGTYAYKEAGRAFNSHNAWVVTKDDGAVWATDVDPGAEPSSGGLIIPLNQQAIQDADVGSDAFDSAGSMFPDASSGEACAPPA